MPVTTRIEIPDVPDASAAWLLDTLRWLGDLPARAGEAVSSAGEIALVVAALAWFVLLVRVRAAEPAVTARVAVVPAGAVAAWLAGELAKQVEQVDRPCRLVDGLPAWADCPAPGDWSFPSNHAAIAGALAIGIALAAWRARRPGPAVVALIAMPVVAASRVLSGAHFPHDVLAGLVLGGIVALVTVTYGGGLAAPLVVRVRRRTAAAGPG